jgi:hypothetical protein
MNLVCQKCFLDANDIKDRWEILNVFLGYLHSESVEYKIWSQESTTRAPLLISLDTCRPIGDTNTG